MKNCPNCQAKLEENAKFCIHCMTNLQEKKKVKLVLETKNTATISTIAAVLVFTIFISGFSFTLRKNPPITYSENFISDSSENYKEGNKPSSKNNNEKAKNTSANKETPYDENESQPTFLEILFGYEKPSSSRVRSNYSEVLNSNLPTTLIPTPSSSVSTGSSSSSSTSSTSSTSSSPSSSTNSSSTSSSPSSSTNSSSTSSSTSSTVTRRYYSKEMTKYLNFELDTSTSPYSYTVTSCDKNATGEVGIPQYYGDYPVRKIADEAFQNCTGITKLYCIAEVEDAGKNTFDNCTSLYQVYWDVPPLVDTAFDSISFKNCSKLTYFYIKYLTYVPQECFTNCNSLKYFSCPKALKAIGKNAFLNCYNIEKVYLANTKKIHSNAFASCSKLKEVYHYGSKDSITIESGNDYLVNATWERTR